MQRFISLKSLAAAGLVLGALGAASVAHARSDVHFSIALPLPYVYMQPAPVYVQPQPVYVQPQPVYVQPYYGQYYYQQRYYGGHGYQHRSGPNGDLDRDGIRNKHDRDRDGDGIRNTRDRAPNNGYRY